MWLGSTSRFDLFASSWLPLSLLIKLKAIRNKRMRPWGDMNVGTATCNSWSLPYNSPLKKGLTLFTALASPLLISRVWSGFSDVLSRSKQILDCVKHYSETLVWNHLLASKALLDWTDWTDWHPYSFLWSGLELIFNLLLALSINLEVLINSSDQWQYWAFAADSGPLFCVCVVNLTSVTMN